MNVGLYVYLHNIALQINRNGRIIKVDGVANNGFGSVISWCTIKEFTVQYTMYTKFVRILRHIIANTANQRH